MKPRMEAQAEVLDIYLYSAIEGDGYDWFSSEIVESETSALHFREELEKHPDAAVINLYINSPGGEVYEALGIASILRRHPAEKRAIIDGQAASAASFLAVACDKVSMYSTATMMIHNMWCYAAGNANDFRAVADWLDKTQAGIDDTYLAKTAGKITKEQLKEMLDHETVLTAQECLEMGFCDEVLPIRIQSKLETGQAEESAARAKTDTEPKANGGGHEPASITNIDPQQPKAEEIEEKQQQEKSLAANFLAALLQQKGN
jgi:ATP-dependent protease ClpP protease subunit